MVAATQELRLLLGEQQETVSWGLPVHRHLLDRIEILQAAQADGTTVDCARAQLLPHT